MVTEVFRSSELAVRAVCEFGSAACVVTFDSYSDDRDLDRKGFGEDFLRDRSIDAIHFISRENDWYQYPEMPAVAAAVAELVKGYERVVAYGSSMGGYAAIRFGGAAGASEALALSPQFSIDRRVVPFEKRWKADSVRIDFSLERRLKAPFVDMAYIAYDPRDNDRRHADLFRRRTRVIDVCLPNVGHPATGPIAEAGILGPLLLDVVGGRVDLDEIKRRVLLTHTGSAHLHFVMSSRARFHSRRLGHAARAAAMAPENFGYAAHYATLLAEAGRFEESQIAFARAASVAPDHPVLLYKLAEFHERRGDLESAVEMARLLVAVHSETYRPRLEYLQKLQAKNAGWLSWLALILRGRGMVANLPRPIGVRVTTTPSPPHSSDACRRHEMLMARRPLQPVDVMLVGDSLAENWPGELWAPLSVFNFGMKAEKTQQTLWRLEQLAAASIDCRNAVVLLGTNNLRAGDTALAIVAGLAAVVAAIVRVAPRAKVHVIAMPTYGHSGKFRSDVRKRSNAVLARLEGFETINADAILAWSPDGVCENYEGDHIHLSAAGYGRLTDLVRRKLA